MEASIAEAYANPRQCHLSHIFTNLSTFYERMSNDHGVLPLQRMVVKNTYDGKEHWPLQTFEEENGRHAHTCKSACVEKICLLKTCFDKCMHELSSGSGHVR